MKYITVSFINIPMRIDRYLRNLCSSLTQGTVQKYIRNGNIKLHGKRIIAGTRICFGDVINVSDTIYQMIESEKFNQNINKYNVADKSLAKKILSDYLIFSCKYFIAVNKPYNLAVQGGTKINLSIDSALSYINRSLEEDKQLKLVHRLDKDTSGVIIIARGHDNSVILTNAFRNRLLLKRYIAILCGIPKQKQGSISNNLNKDLLNDKKLIQVVNENGKFAKTDYKILFENNNYSLVEFTPITGRTHQIRVHSKELGCPILGDTKYGGQRYNRIMLHSCSIEIPKFIFDKSSDKFTITSEPEILFQKFFK